LNVGKEGVKKQKGGLTKDRNSKGIGGEGKTRDGEKDRQELNHSPSSKKKKWTEIYLKKG